MQVLIADRVGDNVDGGRQHAENGIGNKGSVLFKEFYHSECRSVVDMALQVPEIPEGLPADFENLLKVDGVDASLPGLEGDYLKGDFLVEIGEVGCQHDVRQVEVLRHLLKVLLNEAALHQPERSIGVRDADAEGELKDKAKGIFDKLP